MVTLYHYTVWEHSTGLTVAEIMVIAGVTGRYLLSRLPVFAGKSVYRLTNKVWKHTLVSRRAVERNNRAMFIYRLSAGGRKWCEESLPRAIFWKYVRILERKVSNTCKNTVGDNGGFDAAMFAEYRDTLAAQGILRLSVAELQSGLSDMGISGDLRGNLGKKLKASGFQYKQGRKGNYYEILSGST